MYRYKKLTEDGYCLYASANPPKNFEGLIEITAEEYEQLLAELKQKYEEEQQV